MSTNLLDRTRALMARSTMTQRKIAEGAGVSYWWYIKFAQGSIPDPGISNLQKVHDFLSKKQAAA